MNKRQLIAAAARRSSLSQGQVGEALAALLAVIAAALAGSDHVVISGFGRFDAQPYAARKLRRFDGQGCYEVAERRLPVFRSSQRLRQKLRRNDP